MTSGAVERSRGRFLPHTAAGAMPRGVRATAVAGFKGTLVRPDDRQYDAARQLWNGAIDRGTALIARCAAESDAPLAPSYALERGLPEIKAR